MELIRTKEVQALTQKNYRPTTILRSIGPIFGVALLICASAAIAQSDGASSALVPPPDPGYGLYFHDSAAAPEFASRWGYHDGWTEGRHDRNHGDQLSAQEKEHYETPPDHGPHPGMTHEQYVRQYRAAYVHGYEHGSRI
ncbi:MAG TPA: hypothetical protein VK720_01010 [Terracidiphilus sp.]|jgi:hypothetical protein|nr:hypothetical protein [Terracidiphilus sp.]